MRPSRIHKYFDQQPARPKHREMLDLWNKSIAYFNQIHKIIKYFPEDASYDLDQKLKSSALSIPNNIAKGSHSRNNDELKNFMNDAKESVSLTVSNLFIANKYKYVRKDMFNQIYYEGEKLNNKLEGFLGQRRSGQNN